MNNARIQGSIARITQYFADNPDQDPVSDKAAVATLQDGLACRADGANGALLLTDIPKSVGAAPAHPHRAGFCASFPRR